MENKELKKSTAKKAVKRKSTKPVENKVNRQTTIINNINDIIINADDEINIKKAIDLKKKNIDFKIVGSRDNQYNLKRILKRS